MSQRCGGVLAWLTAALMVTAAVGVGVPPAPGVSLTATTALIMGGTLHPLIGEPDSFVDDYLADSLDLFIAPTGAVRGGSDDPGQYRTVALWTPEEFWPLFGSRSFDASVAAGAANLSICLSGGASCVAAGDWGAGGGGPVVVFGYSQSARVATVVHRTLEPGSVDLSFVLAGNPNRPNGGILQRFNGIALSLLGVTFDGASPTTGFPTADISRQYDGWSDFPARPLNLLATVNALLGIHYLHSDYSVGVDDTMIQSVSGDTTYYLVPAPRLPLLMPLELFGVPSPIITALDAPLRVIVEWAYDRADPGAPTTASTHPRTDLPTALGNLVSAIPTGIDDGLAEAGWGRPLGTVAAGPFGVGGPAGVVQPLPRPATPARASAVSSAPGGEHWLGAQDTGGDGSGDRGGFGGRRDRQPRGSARLVPDDPQTGLRAAERGVPDRVDDFVRRHRGHLGGGDQPAAGRRPAR